MPSEVPISTVALNRPLCWFLAGRSGRIAGDDGLGVGPDTGQEHFDLQVVRVLCFIQDDKGIIRRCGHAYTPAGRFRSFWCSYSIPVCRRYHIISASYNGRRYGSIFSRSPGSKTWVHLLPLGRACKDDLFTTLFFKGPNSQCNGSIGFTGTGR